MDKAKAIKTDIDFIANPFSYSSQRIQTLQNCKDFIDYKGIEPDYKSKIRIHLGLILFWRRELNDLLLSGIF